MLHRQNPTQPLIAAGDGPRPDAVVNMPSASSSFVVL